MAAVFVAMFAFAARPARASVEEFSTLDVAHPEEDDENVLDHSLIRTPAAWRERWERAPLAFRTSQGCVTSGQWVLFDDLKLRTATGRQSRFEMQLHREYDNESTFEWVQFEWGLPLPSLPGRFGGRFRPTFDKAAQDFAGWWELGDDSSHVQVRATFTIEDAFNELWSFRQARVGDRSEPYEKHPYEPALRLVWRGGDFAGPRQSVAWNGARGVRFETNAQWLTSSTQRVDPVGGDPSERRTLWGAKGNARAEARLGRWGLELYGEGVQADRSDLVAPGTIPTRWWNRRWQSELTGRVALARAWTAEAHWLYEARAQDVHGPTGGSRFRAVDRLPTVELAHRFHEDWRARVGFMRDRATSQSVGEAAPFTYGDRFETRLYLGLSVRFGQVLLQGVEGVELDREPYEVSFHHDKGLLQLQATF